MTHEIDSKACRWSAVVHKPRGFPQGAMNTKTTPSHSQLPASVSILGVLGNSHDFLNEEPSSLIGCRSECSVHLHVSVEVPQSLQLRTRSLFRTWGTDRPEAGAQAHNETSHQGRQWVLHRARSLAGVALSFWGLHVYNRLYSESSFRLAAKLGKR